MRVCHRALSHLSTCLGTGCVVVVPARFSVFPASVKRRRSTRCVAEVQHAHTELHLSCQSACGEELTLFWSKNAKAADARHRSIIRVNSHEGRGAWKVCAGLVLLPQGQRKDTVRRQQVTAGLILLSVKSGFLTVQLIGTLSWENLILCISLHTERLEE